VGSPVVVGAGETVGTTEGSGDDVGCMLNEGKKEGSNDSVGIALGRLLTVGLGVVEGACEEVGVLVGCALLLGFEVDVGRGVMVGDIGMLEGKIWTNVGTNVISLPASGFPDIVVRWSYDGNEVKCSIEGEYDCPDLVGRFSDGNGFVGASAGSRLEKIVGRDGNGPEDEG
jgi:hypothetical protein